MDVDIMTVGGHWARSAELARQADAAGFSGLLFTETGTTPWMSLATAAQAAPSLELSTGIAVAFVRSPMVSAQIAWELAANTGGKFRLGLGTQVRAHIERRYGAAFDEPGRRLRDYVRAVRATFRAFAGEEPLNYQGEFTSHTLLPRAWAPDPLPNGTPAPKIDISAVNPFLLRIAGEVADGVHIHPLHSMPYLRDMAMPEIAAGAAKAGRSPSEIDLIIPVFTIVGNTYEEQEPLRAHVRQQVAFYGSTKPYAHQFERLGYPGISEQLGALVRVGDVGAMNALITDEMLEHFAITATWDELADRVVDRYRGVARRVVFYCVEASRRANPTVLGQWGEVARAVRGSWSGVAT